MFDLTIITPERILFKDAVDRVFLDGDDTEYELLSFHASLLGVLRRGQIVIDNKKAIPIQAGVVKFFENKCVILIQELRMRPAAKK